MRHPEPPEVRDQIAKGELGVQFVQRQVTLFVPLVMMVKVKKPWVLRMAREIYGLSVIREWAREVWTWDLSMSFGLPPLPQIGQEDPRLRLLMAMIRKAHQTSPAYAEKLFSPPATSPELPKPEPVKPAKSTRKRKPEPGATQPDIVPGEPVKPEKARKPYTFQIPRPPKEESVILEEEDDADDFVPLSIESFSAKFGPNKTEFFIPPICIIELGRHDISGLAKTVYNANTLKRFEMPRWEKKDSILALVLPPTYPHCGKYTDPRIEKLKLLILAAHNRRRSR